MKLFLAILLLSLVYIIGWYQLHGQFINEWFRKWQHLLIILSIPTTYVSIKAIKLVNDYFEGKIWPNRILTFTIGIILFTALTTYHFDEKFTLKTLTLISLCGLIVFLQVVWR
jgi:hypothetical protein